MNKNSDATGCYEVTVSVKGSDQSFKKKYLSYEEAYICQEDPIIKSLIEDAKKECKFEIEEVTVRVSF